MSLFSQFKKRMPSVEEIAEAAAKRLASKTGDSPVVLRQNFSALTLEIEKVGYEIYLQKQFELGEELLCEFCRTHGNKPVFEELNSFFLSLTQSRRTRAGKTFEETIKGLFRRCDYPFEEQCIINGKPDFLMPSEAHYHKNAPDCIIFTAKRTLRERWRQIATEGVRGKGLFLATLDGGISANQAEEMLANRIYMVVPKNLKQSKPVYQNAPNIISFEDFFTDHLDPAIARWRRAKII